MINCLAYIDLNPIRANLVERPDEYRWSSIGYHVQRGNQDGFLSTDFGLSEFGEVSSEEMLWRYREFLYKKDGLSIDKGISEDVIEKENKRGFRISQTDRFRYRCRYFTDSGIIGTKSFVSRYYELFKDYFRSKREKKPKAISGLTKIYSLKHLSEVIS